MKAKIKIEKEVELNLLVVRAEIRYWDDAKIDGIALPESGEGMPCKTGDIWNPMIEIETGIIQNWESGKTGDIHFKVCDQCAYHVSDDSGKVVLKKDWSYVPEILYPGRDGYGDYIIMKIDDNGVIENWKKELALKLFEEEED